LRVPLAIWPTTNQKLKSKLDSKKYSLNVYECDQCNLIQLQNMSETMIKKIYSRDYLNIEGNNEIRNNSVNKLIKKIKKNKIKYLDIGGLNNSPKINDNRVSTTVLDPAVNENNFQSIRSNIENFHTTNKYDLISMFHTLEHFENPRLNLDKIYSMMLDDGFLVIEVPNFEFYLKSLHYYCFFHQHILNFTKNTLVNLLLKCGFEIYEDFSTHETLHLIFRKNKFGNHKSVTTKQVNLYEEYVSSFNKTKLLFDGIKGNLSIFGAGGSTTLLLNLYPGLKKKLLRIYDNDLRKIGKYVPGTNIKVSPPEKKISELVLFHTKDIYGEVSKEIQIKKGIILK
jgi:predicted SAM-dependent methyltransferase